MKSLLISVVEKLMLALVQISDKTLGDPPPTILNMRSHLPTNLLKKMSSATRTSKASQAIQELLKIQLSPQASRIVIYSLLIKIQRLRINPNLIPISISSWVILCRNSKSSSRMSTTWTINRTMKHPSSSQ